MTCTWRREGAIAFVELDSPPVNAIGHAMRRGLLEAVQRAESEAVERVIVSGAGRAFAAGADAREFDAPPAEPHLPDILNAIEASKVPWIAAIHGVALGGGAEIALACRMRVMAPGAKIGLPEVTLGVIPGAGGTQRLPRLVGVEKALSMITSGKPLDSDVALATGVVDVVADDPIAAAKAVALDDLAERVPTASRPVADFDASIFERTRGELAARSAGQIAPQRAVDIIERGISLPFDEALKQERQAFVDLRTSAQAKALRHIFFAERAAKPPRWLSAQPNALDHIAIVGGGTMGAGIAYAVINAGLSATIIENDHPGIARAQANVQAIIDASLKRGLIDADDEKARMQRLTITTDYAAASDAQLAIEAAFEEMSVKKAVFLKLEEALPPSAIFATNTSYLDVDEIARVTASPERVLGLHFFAPAHIMKLLEIVKGKASGEPALATGYALAKKLRKVPVLAGVCDGFIGNRIYARYREAADTVLLDGSTPAEIDAAMREFGYAMGPFETQDLSGLDIGYATRRRQDATRDPERRYVAVADRMVEAGRLGRKTGAGWYRYQDGKKRDDPDVIPMVEAEAARVGAQRRAFSVEEIQSRLLLAMINEATQLLDEGIAQNARDIDLVSVFGYGFPRWRGGLMHYADGLGAGHLVSRLGELGKEDHVAWRISALLKRCAETGLMLKDVHPTEEGCAFPNQTQSATPGRTHSIS